MMEYLGNDQVIDDEERIWKIEKVGWMCVSDNGVGVWGLGIKCRRIGLIEDVLRRNPPDSFYAYKSWLVDEIIYKEKQINQLATETFISDIIFRKNNMSYNRKEVF